MFWREEATRPFSSVFFNGLPSTPASRNGGGVIYFQQFELHSEFPAHGQVSNPTFGVHGHRFRGNEKCRDVTEPPVNSGFGPPRVPTPPQCGGCGGLRYASGQMKDSAIFMCERMGMNAVVLSTKRSRFFRCVTRKRHSTSISRGWRNDCQFPLSYRVLQGKIVCQSR
ncbi:hypothetical protein TNCV_4294961 [Trichonephila clavipes]|uniref:Uncharacterized protein n=1 Tax=Trichonephila clavipes TaxID=2585209 RepID=A0A8X6V616_TRICX|nr:hypothetical protein TNCV_4294961 [Trichonephila clavipes]